MPATRFRVAPAALLLLALVAPCGPVRAQGPPLFTSDYYLVEPARWVDKEVTLSVTHVKPGEGSEGGRRRLEARTFFNRLAGGKMDVVAPEPIAARIIRQCGTQKQPLGRGQYRVTQIHGVLKREASGRGGDYYLLAEK